MITELSILKEHYKRVEEDKDRALKTLKIPKSKSVMYSTIQFEIRNRIPDLTEEQVEEVAKLIGEYR